MIDSDFLRYAIKQKQDQMSVAEDPLTLRREIRLLTERLDENDKNMHRLSGQSDTE